ncbi:hypothetical protein, partial [Agrobacterium tumefaciens]|uniref:hypothetical protein n=1 Tax=Agrobacterium tumefaciens TaxID=358 RepID=UPI001962C5EF
MTIQGVDTQSSANRAARAAQRYFSRRNTTYDRFSQPPAITSALGPNFGSPGVRVFRLLLWDQTLDRRELEFSGF